MVGRDEIARAYQPISSYGVIGDCGIDSCPNLYTHLDKRRSRRPDPVRRPQRSCYIPGRDRIRSCPREDAGWNVLPLDQQLAPPLYVQAHPPAGLACFSGVSLHRLLPHDL